MDTMQTVREFLGWCTLLNMGLLLVSAVTVLSAGGTIRKVHARMFGLADEDLSRAYFQYLAQYKLAILIFNLVPYVAVCILA